MQYPGNHVRKKYVAAEKPIRDFIGSEEFSEILNKITSSYALDDDQKGALGDIAIYALLELFPIERLPAELGKNLGVSDNVAQHITNELQKTTPLQITKNSPAGNREVEQKLVTPINTDNKSLVDHITAYEERKKKKQEEEKVQKTQQQQSSTAEIPPNLPVGPKEVVEQYEKEQEKPKTRPAGPDPYHEPIDDADFR